MNTLVVNLAGAVLIGIIISCSKNYGLHEKKLLFFKVGMCGGLVTFSTFSAETLVYVESGNLLFDIAYAVVSVVLCISVISIGSKIIYNKKLI